MNLKNGSYYLVKQNNYNNDRTWCFIYYNSYDYDIRLIHNVHGYSKYKNNDLNFFEKFYDTTENSSYVYQEISIDKAMKYFPINDIKKMNYLRKERIKLLLQQ